MVDRSLALGSSHSEPTRIGVFTGSIIGNLCWRRRRWFIGRFIRESFLWRSSGFRTTRSLVQIRRRREIIGLRWSKLSCLDQQ